MHQHTCVVCDESFDCLVENCTDDNNTAVCDECAAEDYEDEI